MPSHLNRPSVARRFIARVAVASLMTGIALPNSACSLDLDLYSPPEAKSTESLETSSLRPAFSAQSYGDGIVVYASLFQPGGYRTRLATTDGLFASDGTNRIPLVEYVSTDGRYAYKGTLPANVEGVDVTVSLERGGASKLSATRSVIRVPAPFAVTSSVPESVTSSTVMKIELTPPMTGTESARVRVYGDCFVGFSFDKRVEVKSGAVSFSMAEFSSLVKALSESTDAGATKSCPLNVGIGLTTLGTYDAAFGTAQETAEGLQERSFKTILVLP